MSGIVLAALVAAAAATLVWGSVILRRAAAADRRMLVMCFLLQLPMSAAAFYLVRVPLDDAMRGLLGDGLVMRWGRMLFAPLTEEPAKLWPLLIPWIAAGVSRRNATHVAAALGLGFGVGEIGVIADFIRSSGQGSALPWYVFTGFMVERFMVCLMHGLLTAMAVLGWKSWRIGLGGGIALAMLLHLALNFPIAAAHAGWLGSDPTLVATLMSLWNAGYFIAALLVLVVLDNRVAGLPSTAPAVVCPKCGGEFRPSAVPLNLIARRLERCPHCRRWSLV